VFTETENDPQLLKSGTIDLVLALQTGRLPTALSRLVARSAAYDAQERYPLPLCLPGTRHHTLDTISRWFEAGAYKVCWLHGAPGTGKSAVAQTFAEAHAKRGRLAASFFCSRYDSDRNTMNRLFPTLAAQIAMCSSDNQKKMEQIFRVNPLILDRINGAGHLIGRLLSGSLEGTPSVVVIDGLDQYQGSVEQRRTLMNIHRLFVEYPRLPLRFLIVSRPESRIKAIFDGPSVITKISTSISLDEVHGSSQDVFKFLQSEFSRIRDSAEHKEALRVVPKPWPSTDILQQLAIESEGSFISAVNIVNYVKGKDGSCVRRLDMVLGMTSFHKLCILGSVHRLDPEVLKRILGFALFPNFFQEPVGVSEIQYLLGLPPGNAIEMLRNLDPILHFELPPDGISFRFQVNQHFKEFFLDRTLSQDYHIDCHEWLEDTFRDILRSVSLGTQEGNAVR